MKAINSIFNGVWIDPLRKVTDTIIDNEQCETLPQAPDYIHV